MSDSLHPTEGVRLLLERESVADDKQSAAYRCAIYAPEHVFVYRGELRMDGSADLICEGAEAPASSLDSLSKIAKSTARAAKRKQEESLPPWPNRVLRWRGPGRG